MPKGYKKDYDHMRMVNALKDLMANQNESMREASMRSGLDHGAIRRYVYYKQRPTIGSTLLMADHFGVNPNDLLELAGYTPMKMFEREALEPDKVTPEVLALVRDLGRIGDIVLRRRLVEAMRLLIGGYVTEPETGETAKADVV